MAKKSKKSKKAKKGNPKKKQWCTEDLDFDENGNLVITNKALSTAIWKAIYQTNHRFCIRVKRTPAVDLLGFPDEFDRKAAKKGDPLLDDKAATDDGRPPANAMCPC